jgi:hypothetical protein
MSGAPFKKLPASPSVSSPSVPVADRGGEEVNIKDVMFYSRELKKELQVCRFAG